MLDEARGFRGSRSKLIRQACNAVDRANAMAYTGRKQKKRLYRRLWNARINAACRAQGMRYSEFIHGLKLAGVELNRKVLSNLAIEDPEAFSQVLDTARQALSAQTA